MAATPSLKSQGMKFAEQQLHKHGWTEGKGLGKKESGISEAIKVKVKCDNAGVGHNSAEQFTFHWWDHVFNKTASSIAVEPDQDGVQVKKVKEDDSPVTNKKPRKALTNPNMLYGRFIKSATLLSGGEEPVEKESSSDSSEDEDEKLDLSSATKVTDEDLVRICGGRTAHKGARHGLTMSAKLLRIEEQERAFLEKYQKKECKKEPARCIGGRTLGTDAETDRHKPDITNEDSSSDTTKSKRKKKKSKKTVHEEETLEEDETSGEEEQISSTEQTTKSRKNADKELVDTSCGEVSSDKDSGKGVDHTGKELKSKKKKKKGVTEESDDFEGHAPTMEEAVQSSKKRRVEEKDDVGEELLNGHQEQAPSEDRPSKKKKKRVEEKDDVCEELLNGHQEQAPSEDRQSKKKKKKRRVEEDDVCEELLNGHQEQPPSDQPSKKKKVEKDDLGEELLNGHQEQTPSDTRPSKKKKKSRRDLEEQVESTEDVQSAKKKKKHKKVEEVDDHVTLEECQTKKKKSKHKSKDSSIPGEELHQPVEDAQHKTKSKTRKRTE